NAAITSRKRSGSRRAASSVELTRSANRTVTTLRSSVVRADTGAPHRGQKRASSGNVAPHRSQRRSGMHQGYGPGVTGRRFEFAQVGRVERAYDARDGEPTSPPSYSMSWTVFP